ncbi:MAG: DUF6894 family protein [Janthinobacterium lividum]
MSRYRFQIFDGRSVIEPQVVELANLAAARREGIRRAGATLVLDAQVLTPDNDWRLDVTDEHGTLLFRYDFAMTISPAARAQGDD